MNNGQWCSHRGWKLIPSNMLQFKTISKGHNPQIHLFQNPRFRDFKVGSHQACDVKNTIAMDQATIRNKQNNNISVYRYRRKWRELHYIARSRRHAGICRQAKSATVEAFYVKEYSGLVVLNIISDSRRIGWARLSGIVHAKNQKMHREVNRQWHMSLLHLLVPNWRL